MAADLAPTDLTAAEAREFVEHVRASVEDLKDWIVRAVKGRAWVALGYASWDEMCEAEFDGAVIRLPREDRREAVASLREAGLSTRAIGSALGTSYDTVQRDLREISTDRNLSVESVTSLDGRERPASQPPRPADSPIGELSDSTFVEPEPEPVPLPDGQADADEIVAEIDARQAEPQSLRPSAAVGEFLDSDKDLQRARYLHEFMRVLTRSDDFMEFDPETLGGLGDRDLSESLENYLIRVRNFVETFRKASPTGLRVIGGGKQ